MNSVPSTYRKDNCPHSECSSNTKIASPAELLSSTFYCKFLFADSKKIFGWRRSRQVSLLNSVPERNREAVWRNMNEEKMVLILNMRSGNIYVYGGKEARIWELCDGKRTCRHIVSVLRKDFPDAREKEVLAFISKLAEDKLVFLAGQSPE